MGAERRLLGVGCWVLGVAGGCCVGCWVLCWVLGVGCWVLGVMLGVGAGKLLR